MYYLNVHLKLDFAPIEEILLHYECELEIIKIWRKDKYYYTEYSNIVAPGIFDFLPPSVSEDPRRLGFIEFFNLNPYTNTNTNVNKNISENVHTNTNTNINTNPLCEFEYPGV